MLLSVDPVHDASGGGSGLLVRLRDPEAQRKIGRQLQIADRLAAIGKVSGGVAHEVKNPLNAILLHVEVARAKLASGDTDVGPQMEIIAREILRLDRVVKTFLDFTRPVELNLTTVPLDGLVGEIVDLARPQAALRRIRIEARQQAEGAEVRVDRDLLKQAVLNVVMNAMQAMPEGGELRFESSATADAAEIRISDTGPGIPAGTPRQDLPPVLHHPQGRLRNRIGHDLPDRAITRWYNRFHERTWPWHDVCDSSAVSHLSGPEMKLLRTHRGRTPGDSHGRLRFACETASRDSGRAPSRRRRPWQPLPSRFPCRRRACSCRLRRP